MLSSLTSQLQTGQSLDAAQVRDAVHALVDEQIPTANKAEFLAALARKGESVDEIAAFARELRERAVQPALDGATRADEILDVCGTGGDRLNTFNISTTVALVVASAGVLVAKHGNRAITSQSGSADVLEALGVRIDLEPGEAAAQLRQRGFAFFFAPRYHPAFKHIGPARKLCAERGQRTIFNFLGPLLNPVRPSAQLLGVPRPDLCEPLARVLQELGVRRGLVVCGHVELACPAAPKSMPAADAPVVVEPPSGRHLDEFSTLGHSTIAEFYQDRGFAVSAFGLESFPMQPATLADLAGGDRDANAAIVRRILGGQERGPKRDAVLLNAGAALFVAGRVRSITAGWELAASLIDSGQASRKLTELATS